MKTKIYYSIQDGGDGSAGVHLTESRELAEIDQEFDVYTDTNIWAEDCSGWITIESDSPIKVCGHVQTVEEAIKEIEEDFVDDCPEERLKALKKLQEDSSA